MNRLKSLFGGPRKPSRTLTLIKGTATWAVRKDPESGILVAECSPLRLVAWGYTQEQLMDCAEEALDLLFSHLAKHNELVPFMEQRGFSVTTYPIAPVTQTDAPASPVNGTTNRLLHPGLLDQYA